MRQIPLKDCETGDLSLYIKGYCPSVLREDPKHGVWKDGATNWEDGLTPNEDLQFSTDHMDFKTICGFI